MIGYRVVAHQVITTVTNEIRVVDGDIPSVRGRALGRRRPRSPGSDRLLRPGQSQQYPDSRWSTEQHGARRLVAVDEVWLSGVNRAKPGILVPANPSAANTGWLIAQPPGEDGDAAAYTRIQQKECVPTHRVSG